MDKQMVLLLAVMAVTALYAAGERTKTSKKHCVQIVTVIMTLFSGLRSWWMGDLIKYYTLYIGCSGEQWVEYVFRSYTNLGLKLFFHFSNSIGLSYDFCIFLIAAFSAITLGVLVFRYSPSPYFSYLMYIGMGFYIFTFTGLKQTVAMGFLCISMIAILEGNLGKFILWTALGGLFHTPAFIFLAAYPFARTKKDGLYLIALAAGLALIFIFRDQIVSWMSDAYYQGEGGFVSSDRLGGRFFMMLAILALGLYMRPINRGSEQYNYVFNIMVIAAALQTFSMYSNNFTRLADYYYQFVVLYVPMLMESAYEQIRNGESADNIKPHSNAIYLALAVGITAFSLWYYSGYISSSYMILNNFKFRWQVDAHSLYGI